MAGWYASQGWFNRTACGELVGKSVGEGTATCKDCIAVLEKANDRFRAVRTCLADLTEAVVELGLEPTEALSRELRWRLLALAGDTQDYIFWVENKEGVGWRATEVETGISGEYARNPKAALESYWRDR